MPASAAAGTRRYHLAPLEQGQRGQSRQDRCGQQQTGERRRGADARVRRKTAATSECGPVGYPEGGASAPEPSRLQRVGLGQVEGEVVQDPRAQLTDPVIGEERQRAHDQHRRYESGAPPAADVGPPGAARASPRPRGWRAPPPRRRSRRGQGVSPRRGPTASPPPGRRVARSRTTPAACNRVRPRRSTATPQTASAPDRRSPGDRPRRGPGSRTFSSEHSTGIRSLLSPEGDSRGRVAQAPQPRTEWPQVVQRAGSPVGQGPLRPELAEPVRSR